MVKAKTIQEQLSSVDDPLAFLEAMFTFAPIGFQIYSASGQSILVNQAFLNIFGIAPPPEYNVLEDEIARQSGQLELIHQVFAGEIVHFPSMWYDPSELKKVDTAGSKKAAIESVAFPIFDKSKTVKYVCFMIKDVTKEMIYHDKLRISESRFRGLFDSEGVSIFVTNREGTVIEANKTYLNLLGYTREEFFNNPTPYKCSNLTPEKFSSLDQKARQELISQGSCQPYEKEFICKDGKTIPVLVSLANSNIETGECIGIALDLRQLKELEQQWRQAQKMDAIGRLAGGVAHDFNNMLSIIMLQSEQALGQETLEEIKEDVNAISAEAERASRLTRQLLAFSRKNEYEKRNLSLKSIVQEMKPMMSRIIGEDITLEFKLDDKSLVCVDMSQMEQAILNLVVNARDAMPTGGNITIKAEHVSLDQHQLKSIGLSLTEGDYVKLSVSDTGSGMDEKTLNQIFEPFFTTKEKGKGTGIGLSTVFSIIRQFEGEIRVSSSVGVGTTFDIYIPSVKIEKTAMQFVEPLPGEPVVEDKLKQNDQLTTILLVEDEESLRETTASMLRRRKYVVLEAENGRQAEEIYNQNLNTIDLIITDVIMPQMTGPDLIAKLHQTHPERTILALYLSGYSANELSKHGLSEQDSSFLEKPYSTKQLANKVEEILQHSRSLKKPA